MLFHFHCVIKCFRAGKQLIATNRLQNTRFCLHEMFVLYIILCIYKYTHNRV